MNKYVILSTDNNPEYYSLLPLVCYSWNKIGYRPVVAVVGDIPEVVQKYCANTIFNKIIDLSGKLRPSTLAQVIRLFIAPYITVDDAIFITGDSDMVIGKDIFTEDLEGQLAISYGQNLTGRVEIPICYVKATRQGWQELMKVDTSISPVQNVYNALGSDAYSEKWEDYWGVDQKLLTQRAAESPRPLAYVDRRTDDSNHGLPTGRWDRYKWDNIPADIIDVHMLRNQWNAQYNVFRRLWPHDDISFLLKLQKELQDETNH